MHVASRPLFIPVGSTAAGHRFVAASKEVMAALFVASQFTVRIYSHRRSSKRNATDWLKTVQYGLVNGAETDNRPDVTFFKNGGNYKVTEKFCFQRSSFIIRTPFMNNYRLYHLDAAESK